MGVTDSNQVRRLLGELGTSDAVFSADDLFRELGVFEGPEAKQAWFELFVIGAGNVRLTITDSDKVWVLHVDVDCRDVTAFGELALEVEEFLESDCILVNLLLVLLLVLHFLVLLLVARKTHQPTLLLRLFVVVIVETGSFQIHRRVVFVRHVLLLILGLSHEAFDNFDGGKHGFGDLLFNVLDLLLDHEGTHLTAHLVGASLTVRSRTHHVTRLRLAH